MDPEAKEEWIARIAEANSAAVAMRANVEVTVIDARRAGCSWAVIGAGVNTTPQSARERFGKLPEVAQMDDAALLKPR